MACKTLLASLARAPWPFRRPLMASRIGRSSAPRFTSSGIMLRQISGAALEEVAPHLKPLAGPVLAFAGSAGVGTLKFVASVVLSGFLFHLRSGPRGGNKKDSGASGAAAKPGFRCARRVDDTHGSPGGHRRSRPSIAAGRHRIEACGRASCGRAGFPRAGACHPADRVGHRPCFPSSYGSGPPRTLPWRFR